MLKLLPLLLAFLVSCGKNGSDGGAGPAGAPGKTADAGGTTPAPTPTPSPTPSASLPGNKDFTVLDSDGKEHKLSSLVTASYLVITMTESSWLCFQCRGIAEGIDASTAIQGYLKGPKCTYASLLQKADYSDWLDAFPPTTSFVGARAYQTDLTFADIGSRYGVTFDDTPTSFIIDQKGNTVAQGLAADPLSLVNLCN